MSLNQVPKVTIIPESKGAGKTPLIISVLVELSGEYLCFPEAGRSLVGLVYLLYSDWGGDVFEWLAACFSCRF